jgi:altronate dehydratase large subunit
MDFMGYRRPNGSVGIRNHVVVMSSVACANGVVSAIGRQLPAVKTITHTEGCGRGPADITISWRTLTGLGKNPNVAALLVVGLGCEFIPAAGLAADVAGTGKPVEALVIQEKGGSRKTTEAGVSIAKQMLADADRQKREACDWSDVILATNCGGSDALSGVTANPLVGSVSDWLVSRGGTTMLSETTEMIGTEHVLSRRADTPEVGRQIYDLIMKQRKQAQDILGPLAHMVISPGNIEGGLSNIMEKSMGCIIKAGTTPLKEVSEYAVGPTRKGFVIMDTPGSDIFSVTGMAAGGAQVMIFTTGRGTPVGFPIMPLIKVASSSELYNTMEDDMDVNAGRLLEGTGIQEATEDFVDLLTRVAGGQETKAEINRQDILSINTVSPPF